MAILQRGDSGQGLSAFQIPQEAASENFILDILAHGVECQLNRLPNMPE